ncbi:permease-like cell division protein FtsX [Marinicella sp. S1101]|uniref:cell division protein FtsX n=1 Tax=Marinicella marina TaxID=2996016 RepID=UPI002260DDD7|nr:permease-like cell division protein FtsX [Marinicella marina]MCX7553910.1 permease-like cell division protein FtsX [Marinicella marina]MDJ1140402.1 permease-like cell division protein FtsX [Marinicella marina]
MNQITQSTPDSFSRWYRGHLRAMKEGLRMPLHAPFSSLFMVITLAICFYLPLVMWTLWQNFSEVEAKWQGQGSVAVFLKQGLDATQVQAIKKELDDRALISEVVVVDNDTIKTSLTQDPQLKQIIDVIKSHELPDQIMLKPHPNATSEQLQSLAQKLQLNPDVDYVSFDTDWFNQLKSLTQAFYYLMQASIAVFLVIILVFLSHSIGSEVSSHKAEIGLKKLLGATAAQIRRRFLYGGVYYGITAALVALLMLKVTLWWIEIPIQNLSQSFGQEVIIKTPSFEHMLLFVLIVVLVTWFGSRISASNHIRAL